MGHAAKPEKKKRAFAGEWLPYLLIVGSIWLAWQVVVSLVIVRAPVQSVLALAPKSPELLRRAAEIELQSGDVANARELARASLAEAPFQVRALRVLGLADAKANRVALADEELTLAGNWSLRDTETHAWLVERRLRQGSYTSAFAHADTIARRNRDASQPVFKLFIVAATSDGRSIKPLVDLVAQKPIWRQDFLDALYADPRGTELLATLALALETGEGRLSDRELGQIYDTWLRERRLSGVRSLRQALNRPSLGELVTDGKFGGKSAIGPFAWTLGNGAGFTAEVLPDELEPTNTALWVQTDTFSPGQPARQLLSLSPGRYVLQARSRLIGAASDAGLSWTIVCADNGAGIATIPLTSQKGDIRWTRVQRDFEVPVNDCTLQWLTLRAAPGNRRQDVVAWIDDVSVNPISRSVALPSN